MNIYARKQPIFGVICIFQGYDIGINILIKYYQDKQYSQNMENIKSFCNEVEKVKSVLLDILLKVSNKQA
jgi:hypothetical protein